jgi:hypothetical protein
LSKIQFPELCPVCLGNPEDLVFVTIVERGGDFDPSSWRSRGDKANLALDAAKGYTIFTVPTCMSHSSTSVRSLRTKLIPVICFFILFYPILFFLLQINVALVYSRPLLPPLLGVLVTSLVLLLFFLYGFSPRALERALRFQDVSRVNDSLLVSISNPEYRDQFLELNKMHADEMQVDDNAVK